MKKLIVALVAAAVAFSINASGQQDDQQDKGKKRERKKARTEQDQGQNAAAQGQRQPPRSGQSQSRQGGKQNPRKPSGERQPKAGSGPQDSGKPSTERQPKAGSGSEDTGRPAGEAAQSNRQPGTKQGDQSATTGQEATAETRSAARKNPERKRAADAKKPDVATIKKKNANFHAQPKPDKVKSVTFVQNRTIVGSQNWHGPQYVVFRNYRPVIHDQGWYHSHYDRIILIAGGYYFFNAGYWYPAWGYAPAQQYYAYDGPIYAGREARPPDQVIADVQSALQEMGYYTGEVDGLLGPLTREALNGYQADYDLTVTGAIDEPTLESLELA
jgi:hypothetical protein